jgi:hypothetical protein
MVAAAALMSILVVVVIVAAAVSLRSLVEDEKRTESQLHDPHTPTVTYAIPNGVDPVVFAVALQKAGYVSVVTDLATSHGLRVRCDSGDRERLRHVIEGVAVNQYDGSSLALDHVVFEDER